VIRASPLTDEFSSGRRVIPCSGDRLIMAVRLKSVIELFTKMRETLTRLAPWQALRPPLVAGWVPGRFPHALPARSIRRQRDYFLYIPVTVDRRDRVPLLVMLHGCSQDAHTFAQGSRMNELADKHRFLVLYPQQSLHANALRCWNWFEPSAGDGAGEAAAIAALVRDVTRHYPIDRSRVYVAGISAGGAMTAILALCYGSLFAACAIVAGLMYRAADSALAAARAMRSGTPVSPESMAEEAASRLSRQVRFVPTLVIHGTHDSVVHPRNAEQIVRQFQRFAELRGTPPKALTDAVEQRISSEGRSYHQRDYVRSGQLLLRSILIEGLGHAWSGGDERLHFNDPAQPDTSHLIWDFLSKFRRSVPRRGPPLRLWLRYVSRLLRG
jgi:poly(hydroxyalkanoate) depolymerase family esterase